jgi:hypothetical protein
VVRALADHEAEAGDARHAIGTYERLLDEVMASKPDQFTDLRDAPKLSRIYEGLTVLYGRTGDQTKAAAMNAQRVGLWRQWQFKLPNNAYIRRQLDTANAPLGLNQVSQSKMAADYAGTGAGVHIFPDPAKNNRTVNHADY